MEFPVPKRSLVLPPAPVPYDTHVSSVLPVDIALRCVNHKLSAVRDLAARSNDQLRKDYQFPEHEVLQIDAMFGKYGLVRGSDFTRMVEQCRREANAETGDATRAKKRLFRLTGTPWVPGHAHE